MNAILRSELHFIRVHTAMQTELFDLRKQLYAAAEADIAICGGPKVVGQLLWSDIDVESAQKRISNALNVNQKQEFSPLEILKIKTRAREISGRSNLHELESIKLDCDFKWVTREEKIERVTNKLVDVLPAFASLVNEARDLLLGGQGK